MRFLWLIGTVTGCGYISDGKYDLRVDADQDGVNWLEDCNDNDYNVSAKLTFYADLDGDGYGNADTVIMACEKPEDAVDNQTDCNDDDASIYPGATDTPYDGIDSNCDQSNDCDIDGDGYDGSDLGGLPTDACPDATDCNDDDPDVYPNSGSSELFYNGFDDDCDLTTGDGDADGDGFWHVNYAAIVEGRGLDLTPLPIPEGKEGDCHDSLNWPVDNFNLTPLNGFSILGASQIYPGAQERYYDGIDSDCAGDSDFDQDGDGFNTAHYLDLSNNIGTDCIDSTEDGYTSASVTPADIHPGATDAPYDGVNQDCFLENDFDQDGDGDNISAIDIDGDGTLDTVFDFDGDGRNDFIAGLDCDDSNSTVNGAADEYAGDGVDQNCDGVELCYEDGDGDGYFGNQEVYGDLTCSGLGTSINDCDDSNATIFPNAPELCDGIVNDCGGTLPADEVDNDGDGYVDCEIASSGWMGSALVIGGGDCADSDLSVNPESIWYIDADGDGFGTTTSTMMGCSVGAGFALNSDDCLDSDASTYPGIAFNEADSTVCTADGDGDGFGSTNELCLTISMSDSYGDGWNGDYLQVVQNGTVLSNLTLTNGFNQSIDFCFGDAVELVWNNAGPFTNEVSFIITDSTDLAVGTGVGLSSGEMVFNSNTFNTGDVIYANSYVAGTDCEDGNAAVTPLIDGDNDGDNICQDCDDGDPGINSTIDGDNDGFSICQDCNDNEASINPAAMEIWYDGIDQDCDGWNDYDQDLDGDPSSTAGAFCTDSIYVDEGECTFNGAMWINQGNDCDDNNPEIHSLPLEINPNFCHVDSDNDGFGDAFPNQSELAAGVHPGTDCYDLNALVYPGAAMFEMDMNNDGMLDCTIDADGDGWADATPSYQFNAFAGSDCNDSDPAISPNVDMDGDGDHVCSDCDDSVAIFNTLDNDGDGFASCPDGDGLSDCDDSDEFTFPGAGFSESGFDANDLSTFECLTDVDGDGYGAIYQTSCFILEMTDTYGDGWNGNNIRVFEDGIPYFTLANQNLITASGPETQSESFCVKPTSAQMTLEFNVGSFTEEMQATLYHDLGPNQTAILIGSGVGTTDGEWEWDGTIYTDASIFLTVALPTAYLIDAGGTDANDNDDTVLGN